MSGRLARLAFWHRRPVAWIVSGILIAGTPAARSGGQSAVSWRTGLPGDPAVLATILEAEDRRLPSGALLTLTESPEPAVRARATLALARIAAPSVLPRLLELIRDEAPSVRAVAAFGLGGLRYDLALSTGEALRARAREQLLGHLTDDPRVARQAAWALGLIGGATGTLRASLRQAAAQPDAPVPGLAAALLGAWWRQADADAAEVAPFVDWEDPAVRLAAAHALRRMEDPNGLPWLARLLDDTDAEVRLMALEGLRQAPARLLSRLGGRFLRDRDWRAQCAALQWYAQVWESQDSPPSDDAFAAVLRRSLDRNLHVRECALTTLGVVAGQRAVAADRLLEALSEDEESTRVAALKAVDTVGGNLLAAATQRVRASLTRNEAEPSAETAIDALVRLAGQRPLEAIAIVRTAAAHGDAQDLGWVQALVRSGPPQVRAAAREELAKLRPQEAWEVAWAWLQEDLLPLRAAAATGLAAELRAGTARLSDESRAALMDRLWRLYFDAPRRSARSARVAALEAMAQIDRSLLVQRVGLLLREPDRSVRLRSVQLLADDGELRRRLDRSQEDLLLGHDVNRTAEDYLALAERALNLQQRPASLSVRTPRGDVLVQLHADWAPLTVIQFLDLAAEQFFDGSLFERVDDQFVARGGGRGQPPWQAPRLRSETVPLTTREGLVGLALAGADTGGSRFFISLAPHPDWDGSYPLFGQVVEGARVAARIQPGDRMIVRVAPAVVDPSQ